MSRPKLQLISVATRKIPTHVRALMRSIEVLREAGLRETPAKIVGPAAARGFLAHDPRAEFIAFEQLPDWYRDFTAANWNVFVKDHLFRHTEAEHVMTIHDDGFALHAEHWDERIPRIRLYRLAVARLAAHPHTRRQWRFQHPFAARGWNCKPRFPRTSRPPTRTSSAAWRTSDTSPGTAAGSRRWTWRGSFRWSRR